MEMARNVRRLVHQEVLQSEARIIGAIESAAYIRLASSPFGSLTASLGGLPVINIPPQRPFDETRRTPMNFIDENLPQALNPSASCGSTSGPSQSVVSASASPSVRSESNRNARGQQLDETSTTSLSASAAMALTRSCLSLQDEVPSAPQQFMRTIALNGTKLVFDVRTVRDVPSIKSTDIELIF